MHIHRIKSHEIESYTGKKRRIEEVKQEYYSHRKVRSRQTQEGQSLDCSRVTTRSRREKMINKHRRST